MVDKNFIFLSSMPRAGNTVIGSIINSNKNVKCTANSILTTVIYELLKLKKSNYFINFPDHQSYNNILKNLLNIYYKDWDCKLIIERSAWGTEFNLNYLDAVFKEQKFLILWRPVLECLASFIKLNLNNFLKNEEDIRNYIKNLMDKERGTIGVQLQSMRNIIKYKKNNKIIYYKDFANNPKSFFSDLSSFIKFDITIPDKIDQFTINNVNYDDESLGQKKLHLIKKGPIKEELYDIEKYVPKDIIDKYKNESF